MVLRETLRLRKPKYLIEKTLTVHFVLIQNEPKNQGCEKIVGGHEVSATFYQWSTSLNAC